MNKLTFGAHIKSERKRLRLTQAEAAAALEVPARTLWEWEHDKTEPLPVAQEGVRARFQAMKAPPHRAARSVKTPVTQS